MAPDGLREITNYAVTLCLFWVKINLGSDTNVTHSR